MSIHRDRPSDLFGLTQRINTGYGKVYVIVNVDAPDGTPKEELVNYDPFEVFVVTGQSGGLFSAHAEGLGKTISNALRASDDPGAMAHLLAKDLAGTRASKAAVDHGDMIWSIEDAVGIAILRFLDNKLREPIRGDAEDATKGSDYGPDELL